MDFSYSIGSQNNRVSKPSHKPYRRNNEAATKDVFDAFYIEPHSQSLGCLTRVADEMKGFRLACAQDTQGSGFEIGIASAGWSHRAAPVAQN